MAITGTGGSINFFDDRPLLTGSFSQLDTAALIEAQMAVRRLPAAKLESRISENDIKIAALTEAKNLLGTLGGTLSVLRNPPGISGVSANVFEQKAVFLTANGTTAATEILGATVENTSAAGIHEIIVDQVASAHKVSSATIADPLVALGVTETLTIGLAGAPVEEQFALDVDATMTASGIVSAINTQTGVTGVRASLIKIADADYRVVVTAAETNKEVELIGTSGATTAALSLSADNGATYNEVLQIAQGSRIFVDGIADPIERDGNEISDVIAGVTLDLFKADAGTTVSLEIEHDLSAVSGAMSDFVEGYNAARTYLREQLTVNTEGEVAETALLFGNNLVRTLANDFSADLAALVNGLDAGALSNLRDIGITLDAENLLTIDDGKLDAALVDKLDQVRGVLEFGFQSDSTRVGIVKRETNADLGTFTINVPAGAIEGTNVQVAGVDAFAVDGNILRGLEGTAYEGLSLAYVRDTTDPAESAEDITITTTLGIAERLFQTTENYNKSDGGLLTDEIARFEEQNADFEREIAAIDERMAIIQQSLIEKYAALEQAIAQAEAITSQLKAFLDASNRD
jgi:flagellar hook-associated protein 2